MMPNTIDDWMTLSTGYDLRIKLTMLRLDHSVLRDISDFLRDGEVIFDANAEITRACTLTLLDPDYELGLDSPDLKVAELFMTRMIRVEYGFKPFDAENFNYVPVFTGPIVTLQREGAELQLELMGKEHLAMSTITRVTTFGAQTSFKHFLSEMLKGEHLFREEVNTAGTPLRKKIVTATGDFPWRLVQRAAARLGFWINYNGEGRCRVYKPGTMSVFTFNSDWIIKNPKVTHNSNEFFNCVLVIGESKARNEQTKDAYSEFPFEHPHSPWSLGRNMEAPRQMLKIIESSSQSQAELQAEANAERDRLLNDTNSVTFESLPMPFLEEFDRVTLAWRDEDHIDFYMKKWTLPLTHSAVSTIEFTTSAR